MPVRQGRKEGAVKDDDDMLSFGCIVLAMLLAALVVRLGRHG